MSHLIFFGVFKKGNCNSMRPTSTHVVFQTVRHKSRAFIETTGLGRILGVELDSMLNFIEHISSLLKKAYAKTGALRRIRRFVPMDVMLALYILPPLEYCSPLLLGVGKVQANKIEDANHYIVGTLTGHGKSMLYQGLLNICKVDTLQCRKKQQSLILLFKFIGNIGPLETFLA